MLLAIDIGNTNVTLGIVEDGVIEGVRRAGTSRATTTDELEILLRDLLALDDRDLDGVDGDGGRLGRAGADGAGRGGRGAPRTSRSSSRRPAPSRSRSGSTVRTWWAATGSSTRSRRVRLHGSPAIVCDIGTATTLDCVGPDGAFVGGAIAPGLELGLEALAARTAKLPRVELRTPDRVIGRDTVSAIQSGTVFGYQALVAGLLARARDELADSAGIAPGAVHTILTGGLSAAPWARDVAGVDVIDPDLTLKGLAILYSRGRRRRAVRDAPAEAEDALAGGEA